jgi:RNA polymerase-binding protein DksA
LDILTTAQRVALRQTLTDLRRTLQQSLAAGHAAASHEGYRALAGSAHDAGDEANADVEADVAAARDDRETGELRQVEQALVRLDDGTYGLCTECGDTIGYARLMAAPSAARCLACQSSFERSHPQRTPSL